MESPLISPPPPDAEQQLSEGSDDSQPQPMYTQHRTPRFGVWITDPPYTLPPGTYNCPVPTCPSHRRTFKPYWRLNEHMKMNHGWPRKQTQPNLDKRMGNQFRAEHKKRSSAFLNEVGNEGSTDHGVGHLSDDADGARRPRRSGAKKDYSRLFDPYVTTSPSKTTNSIPTNSLLVKLKVRTNEDHGPSSLSADESLDTSITRPSKAEPAEKPDHHIVTEAEQYLLELEKDESIIHPSPQSAFPPSPYTPSTSRLQHPEPASSPADLVNALRDLLTDNKLLVNTLITSERSGTIRPIYHALARRASSIASTQTSLTTTPQAASATPQSSTSPPPATSKPNANTPFTFSGPRTTPFEWELRGQQPRKKRKLRAEREVKSSPLVAKPHAATLTKSASTGSTKPSPAAKTGIKLVLKMTPAKQAVVEEPTSSSSSLSSALSEDEDEEMDEAEDGNEPSTIDDDYDPDETVPVIVGYYGQRHDD